MPKRRQPGPEKCPHHLQRPRHRSVVAAVEAPPPTSITTVSSAVAPPQLPTSPVESAPVSVNLLVAALRRDVVGRTLMTVGSLLAMASDLSVCLSVCLSQPSTQSLPPQNSLSLHLSFSVCLSVCLSAVSMGFNQILGLVPAGA